ncbi:MAG: phosphoadenylyl-sulfate reductase [Pseudomonadota bacterium]
MLDRPSHSALHGAGTLNARFAHRPAGDLVAMAAHMFAGRLAVLSSFGADSAALLHLVAEAAPHLPVLFLDTGKHFPETLTHRRALADRLGLNVVTVRPDAAAVSRTDPDGTLHASDPDACCGLRKVAPLESVLTGYDAWITGRRRHQTFARRAMPVFEADGPRTKVNPMARWSQEEVDAYLAEHDLPSHPLVADGFPSIGCAPCTKRPGEGADARDGRWQGLQKTECGIHFPSPGRLDTAA